MSMADLHNASNRRCRSRVEKKLSSQIVISHLSGDLRFQLKKRYTTGFIMADTDHMLSFLSNKSLNSVDEKGKLQTLLSRPVSYMESAHTGSVGVSPPELMMALLGDLKDDNSNSLRIIRWQGIGSPVDHVDKGQSKYFMFHWQQNITETGQNMEDFVDDWSVRVDVLREPTKNIINTFCRNIIRTLVASEYNEQDSEVDQRWAYFPGLVLTEKPFNQLSHLDMGDSRGLIVHMPLTAEGLVLMILPHKTIRGNGSVGRQQESPQYLFVPYGSYLVLPSSVVHAGCYGSNGNLRFHIKITMREDAGWGRDSLQDNPLSTRFNINSKNFQHQKWKVSLSAGLKSYSHFTGTYTLGLSERFGFLFLDKWTKLFTTPLSSKTTVRTGDSTETKATPAQRKRKKPRST
jgi:hypothetical protein